MNKKILSVILILTLITCIFSACNNNNEENNKKEENNNYENQEVVDENEKVQDMNTYNNGGLFVQYKGKTYYREYSNADVVKGANNAQYDFESETKTTKYVNVISDDGKISNVFEDDGYGKFYILNDRFFFSGFNNKLYTVNMSGKDYIEFCKGQYIGCNEIENKIYYINENTENAVYEVDAGSLKITKLNVDELNEEFYKSLGIEIGKDKNLEAFENKIYNDLGGLFKTKYGVNSGDSTYMVKVRNVEDVGENIYFLIELSKINALYSHKLEEGYERIVSETYSYNKENARYTLLYLYKASDEDNMSGDSAYESGDLKDFEEPLAENEMYLEIKLENKGLRNTFDIRVEEQGGLIKGKRIEYEGTHSRTEGSIKVKVTKEIGALLTVYIDEKIDSQMLIEE